MDKAKVFEGELNWIKDEGIRNFVKHALNSLPDYFYEVAASSSGRYHPAYALGEGGLVRHTKAAVIIAKDLLGLEMYGKFNSIEKDIILAALILHDGMKHGESDKGATIFMHPAVCANWLAGLGYEQYMSDEAFKLLGDCVVAHMGQWNYNMRTNETLPKPCAAIEKFVHQCDYLASRKYLEMKFEHVNYFGDRV